MFFASSLREQAVRLAVVNRDRRITRQIKFIKIRAMLTNFMISRDVAGVKVS